MAKSSVPPYHKQEKAKGFKAAAAGPASHFGQEKAKGFKRAGETAVPDYHCMEKAKGFK